MTAAHHDAGRRFHVVIACLGCGGSGSVVTTALRHARELARYARVSVVSDGFPAYEIPGVAYVPVTSRSFRVLRRFAHVPREYFFTRAVLRELEQLHRRQPIDFVISHTHALAALASWRFMRKHGTPHILIVQADIFDRPRGTYDWLVTTFYRWVTPRAYRRASLVLANSPHMGACARRGGASADKVRTLPNGIDPQDIGLTPDHEAEAAATSGEPRREFRLLFVGRLSVEKGLEVLLAACEKLQAKSIPFRLTLIGEGSQRPVLENLMRRSGLAARLDFLGNIRRTDLAQYYSAAHVVCVPSLSEPQGVVVLEALTCGRPVVGSDTGGIPSVIRHEFNGLLVPPNDAEALAAALERCFADRALLRRLSQHARASVRDEFSWPTIGRRLFEALVELQETSRLTTHPQPGSHTAAMTPQGCSANAASE
jgi:glycosyltransferase involved in cell wall biosynthesis